MSCFTKYILFLMLVMLCKCNAKVTLSKRVNVTILNDLGDGTDLKIHCQSHDDDLGEHVLKYQQSFGFHFRNNFFLVTIFNCQMSWNKESHSFDIYDAVRDRDYCGKGGACNWSVRPTGPCLMVNKRVRFICYRWK